MLSYSRNSLLCIRKLWKVQATCHRVSLNKPQNAISSEVWNRLKSIELLRPYRGKRGGRTKELSNIIRAIIPRHFINRKPTRSQPFINQRNLLNIQIVASPTIVNSEQQQRPSPLERSYFVPSLLLSNTMSLAPKIDEIAHSLISNKIDVAFFTETWLKDSIPDEAINIADYQLFRRDRKLRTHGGVCLFVNNFIFCRPLPDLQSEDHEVLWVLLRPSRLPRGFSNIITAVVYHPPDADCPSMREYIRSSLVEIESTFPNSAVIIAGDFNRLDLKSTAQTFQLKPVIEFPTRGVNTLDQIFTNLSEYYCHPSSAPPFGLSDHLTIIMNPGVRKKLYKSQTDIIKVRDKRPSKKASVGRYLQEIPWTDLFLTEQSCDEKLSIMTQIISYGLDVIMPERSIRVHATDRPWMNSKLKSLIARRQKAFTSGNEHLFKLLRNKVNRECKRCRKIYYQNKVQDLCDTKSRDWWREIKQLCGTTKINKRDLKSSLHPDLIYEDKDLGNKINEAFVSVMENYSPLSEDVCVALENDEPITVTESVVLRKLREISTSRAGGPDNLPSWVLKEFADILAFPVADILNTSFRDCKVPGVWKLADVPPIPKGPTVHDFNKDLRPISLTSTLSKVAESIVIERELKPTLLRSIDPRQFGFIPDSSTSFALISMFHHWLSSTDGTGSSVRTVLLDYRKAFDLVDHNLLVAKLFSLGVKPSIVNWIIDFLRNRWQRVKLNNNYFSDWLKVPAGVPQGTRLGPWLFLTMINDLTLPEKSSSMWKFADDTTISEVVLKSGESVLQEDVNRISKWSTENLFQLNSIKCKELVTSFARTPPTLNPVSVSGQSLERVVTAKLLGVTIRNDLKWNNHVDLITIKAAKRLYLLRQLKRADVATTNLVKFYCSCIRSVLEYACQLFHSSLPQYLSDDIERIQKRAMRIILPNLSYTDAIEKAGLHTLYSRRESLSCKLFNDIVSNEDHKLAELLPPRTSSTTARLRKRRTFEIPRLRTNRLKNSFIMHYAKNHCK